MQREFKSYIRDAFWLAVVLLLALGFWRERQARRREIDRVEALEQSFQIEEARSANLEGLLKKLDESEGISTGPRRQQ